jgi:photosystem II stability/assembly factor-like uncharacterized protein
VSRASFRVAAFLLLASSLAGVATSCGSKTAQTTKPVRAQNTPPALIPNSIAFWDAEHGLIGSGITWRKTGGAISATSGGGKTFHVVLRTPGPVEWVSTAGPNDAWALVEHWASGDNVFFRLLHSSDRGKTWRKTSAAVWNPSFATANEGVAFAPFRARGLPYPSATGPLLETSEGGLSWERLGSPCAGSNALVSFPSPLRIWIVCAGQPGAGNEAKAVYSSNNGGRNWRKLVDVPMTGRAGGLTGYGYPQGISFTPQGYGLLWESRGTLDLTRDGGRHWKALAVAEPELDFGLSAVMLSETRALVLLEREGNYRLLATADGGRSWTVVQRWPG